MSDSFLSQVNKYFLNIIEYIQNLEIFNYKNVRKNTFFESEMKILSNSVNESLDKSRIEYDICKNSILYESLDELDEELEEIV